MVTPRKDSELISNKWLIGYVFFILLSVFGLILITGAHADSTGGFDAGAYATIPTSETVSVIGATTNTSAWGNHFDRSVSFGVNDSFSSSGSGAYFYSAVIFATTSTGSARQTNILYCAVIFATTSVTSQSSLGQLYSSLIFPGIGASSAGSQLTLTSPWGNASIFGVGSAISEASLATLSNPLSFTTIGAEASGATTPSGGFDTVAQEAFYPSAPLPVAGAISDSSLMKAGSSLTMSVIGRIVSPTTYKEASVSFGVGAAHGGSSNATFSSSLVFLAGDYYQFPGYYADFNLSTIGGISPLSDVTINNPTQAYYFSILAGMSPSLGATWNPTLTLSSIGGMSTSVLGQVYGGSTSLSVLASAGVDGYVKTSLPVTYAVSSGQGHSNTEYSYPSSTDPASVLFILSSYLGGGNPLLTFPVGAAYSINSTSVPYLRYGETVNVAMTVGIFGRYFRDSFSLATGAAFQSSVLAVQYVAINLPVANTISPVSRGTLNSSISLPTVARENSIFRKLTDMFFRWRFRK